MTASGTENGVRGMFARFVHSQVASSVVLLGCTLAAMVWANSPWAARYFEITHAKVAISWGDAKLALSVQHWINDLLMAVFFFVVGLEIKRELRVGQLSSLRRAALPVSAALGGMLVPAVLYRVLNAAGEPSQGWGIPMATDIAFALGILALFGSRVPTALKVFLTALAIADDLGAVLVIALFYTAEIQVVALLVAVALLLVLAVANRLHLAHPALYVVLGLGVWFAVFSSGVHATVAGVLVAVMVPVTARRDPRDFLRKLEQRLEELRNRPLTRESMLAERSQLDAIEDLHAASGDIRPPGLTIEKALHPFVAFGILPLFALFNAGVALEGGALSTLRNPVSLGIVLGLVLGKQIGITLFSWLAVRSGRAALPEGIGWRHIYGVACLGGVGFTMSLFVSALAFDSEILVTQAKIGILAASVLAAVWGLLVLGAGLPRRAARALVIGTVALVALAGIGWMGVGAAPARDARTTTAIAAPATNATLALAPSAASTAETGADPEAARTIRDIVSNARHPRLRWSDFPYYQDEMEALYAPRAYAPFWFEGERVREQAGHLVEVLRDAPSRGLDPADYDVEELDAGWRTAQAGGKLTPQERGQLDAAWTLALFRHISDTHIGRITPSRVQVKLDVEPKKYDLVPLVEDAVVRNRIAEVVAQAEPQLAVYRRLRRALATYRQIAADSTLPRVVVAATVRPGDAFSACGAVRRRLVAFGDLGGDVPVSATVYEGELVEAVRRFQERHGLDADGVLGKATVAALDVSPAQRARQIDLALERLRWVVTVEGQGTSLAVNIPAFEMWGFDSLSAEGRPSLRMRVVVGKALNTRTPVFAGEMRYVVFRPYWNVPPSIVRGELLPALRKDPQALATRDMEIVRGFDDSVALPTTPENIAQLSSGRLKVRQRPGPRNALGLAKFIFPNSDNIYMHDTPSTALFARSRRDFSHGCIRVEDPAGLAAFVLADQPEWTPARIRSAMQGSDPSRVNLTRPLPVLIFYSTALVMLDGTVHFYPDIYGHDERLEAELQSAYAFQP